MIPITIISAAFLIGGMMGFFFAARMATGTATTPVPQSTTPAPPYQGGEIEAEMEDRMAAYPMSKKALEAWEKGKAKKGKRRVR